VPYTDKLSKKAGLNSIFSKYQNEAEFNNLDDSEVLSSKCPDLRTSTYSLIGLSSLCNLSGLTNLYSPISSKNILILGTKMTNPGLFSKMNHQISNFSLRSDAFCRRLLRPANVTFLKTG